MSWRDIPMRDINWVTLKPTFGASVYRLRKLCEPMPDRPYRRYASGSWAGLTMGQIADMDRVELMRHDGIGPGTLQILDEVMTMARVGLPITRPPMAAAS